MKGKVIFLLFCVFILLAGCKSKSWEVHEIHKDLGGGDPTASIYQIDAYIYNIYIGLTGRKPDSTEYNQAREALIAAQASRIGRTAFIRGIVEKDEFYENLYSLMRKDVLEDADTSTIREEYNVTLSWLADPQFQSSWSLLEEMKKEYEDLMRIPEDLKNSTIGITGLYRRGIDNDIYDQINMGTENFVVSCFTFYLDRYPTQEELEQSKKMVDSHPAFLFLQHGANKQDFLDIFLNSPAYKEGLIRRLFKRFLYREPSAYERDLYLQNLADDKEYKELFVAVFSSEEYYRQQ